MRQRRYFRIVFPAILCLSLLQLVSWLPLVGHIPAASAHAFVIGSDPIDGSTVSKAPSIVRIYFDAPLAPASSTRVYAFPPGASAAGTLVNASQSVVNAANPDELDTPLLPVGRLPQGSYEVRWTALSMTDGQTTSGLIGFNLGASSTGVAGTPTLGPSTSNYFPQLTLQGGLTVVWDWLVLLALLFWIGILLTDYFIVPRSAPVAFLTQARKHAYSLQSLCLFALLIGEAINLILRGTSFTQTLGSGGISLDLLAQFILHTNYGRLWLVRVGLLLVALLFLWWNNYRQRHFQNTPALPVFSRSNKRLRPLRQQARPEALQEVPATPPPSAPVRAQGRVTGAVAANISPARSATSSLARITIDFTRIETPMQEPSIWQIMCWLLLAGLIVLTLVLSNEVIQLTPMPISTGVFSWLALSAQAIWFGCMAYLGFILLPLLPVTDPDHHAETLLTILKRATPLLLASIGVLLVSDLFLSEATIQTPAQLLNDPYGRALLVRASLLLLMLIFTGYMLFFLLPLLQRQTILLPVVQAELPARRARRFALEKTERTVRRALHALAGLAAVTLICMALMDFFAPPVVFPNVNYSALANQAAAPGNPPAATSLTQRAGELAVTLQVLPARGGVTNTLILIVNDAQGRPVTDATVKLSINMTIMDMGTIKTTLSGNGSVYAATFTPEQTFSMAGPWRVQVEVDRPNQSPVHLTFLVTVTQ